MTFQIYLLVPDSGLVCSGCLLARTLRYPSPAGSKIQLPRLIPDNERRDFLSLCANHGPLSSIRPLEKIKRCELVICSMKASELVGYFDSN